MIKPQDSGAPKALLLVKIEIGYALRQVLKNNPPRYVSDMRVVSEKTISG